MFDTERHPSVNIETLGNRNVAIILDDVFDFKRIDEFRACYESIDAKSVDNISIDFKRTRYMDSSALGMLLNLKSHFKNTDVSIKIISINEQIRKILTISHFDQRFVIE